VLDQRNCCSELACIRWEGSNWQGIEVSQTVSLKLSEWHRRNSECE